MIHLDALTIARAGRPVLRALSLHLMPGQVTVLIGPNGSGKSTLLGAISGALPYGGSVRLNGQEVRRTGPEALAGMRALMSQQAELAFPFRVGDVVALGAQSPAPGRIAPLLAEVGLAGFADRSALALSGGEAERMHLARALLQAETAPTAPFWLLLDEPVSALDLAHQIAVIDRARAFAQTGGGVLMVLHDLNLAVRAADRLIVLQGGELVADGPASQVITAPLIAQVYGCAPRVNRAPERDPFVLVQA